MSFVSQTCLDREIGLFQEVFIEEQCVYIILIECIKNLVGWDLPLAFHCPNGTQGTIALNELSLCNGVQGRMWALISSDSQSDTGRNTTDGT
jgi:hypothetical protein